MNPEIKKGSTVYNRCGLQAEVIHILSENEVLVAPFILIDTGEYGEQEGAGPYEIWREAYIKPPVDVIAPEITKLVEQQTALYAQVAHLRKEREQEEKEIKNRLARLTRHEKLRRLEDYLAGKIQFFVEAAWSAVKILPLADAHDGASDSYYRKPRLLTLYGGSKGELNWNLSQYSDHSGSATTVYPCLTEEEARAKAKELLHEQCAKGPNDSILKNFDKLKIEPPNGYRESVGAMLTAGAEAAAHKARTELAIMEAKVAEMKSKLEGPGAP